MFDLLQHTAVDRASRRDWSEASQEPNCTLQCVLEAVEGYQRLEPAMVVSGRQNEHIAELSAELSAAPYTTATCKRYLRVCGSVDVGDDQSIRNVIKSHGTLHRCFNTPLRSLPDLLLTHAFYGLE